LSRAGEPGNRLPSPAELQQGTDCEEPLRVMPGARVWDAFE